MTEAEHFWKCEFCGGWFDIRDLGAVSITKSPCPIQHAIRCSSLTGHQRSVVMRRRDETTGIAPAKFAGTIQPRQADAMSSRLT